MFTSDFFISTVMIPFLVFALAAIGLNILTGYTGLISLGTGAFMGVGAYACYKLTTIFPGVNIIIWILLSGFFAAGIGVLFGLPSLRIKGFYLAVATLAAQFFLQWSFVRIPWLYNYNASGAIEVPRRDLFGLAITGPNATPQTRYLVLLGIVILLTWLASNLVHGRLGRMWMAVRDMDIAAELMGIRLLPTKLLAFAVSSFFAGVAGACMMFLWYGGGEANDAVQYQPELQYPVHGDYWRAWVADRLLFWCGIYFRPAYFAEIRITGDRYSVDGRYRRASDTYAGRGADYFLPHHRAARAGPSVADHEAEIARLAFPLLGKPEAFQYRPA